MFRRRLIGFTGLLLFTANITCAQDFDRILRWMHNTAAEGDGHPAGDETMMDVTEIPLTNTCQNFSVIQKTQYFTDPRKPEFVSKKSMQLADIDPNNVYFHPYTGGKDTDGGTVWIWTTDEDDVIRMQSTSPVGGGNTQSTGFNFYDTDFAQRFAKAFRHVAELCGGKPSAF